MEDEGVVLYGDRGRPVSRERNIGGAGRRLFNLRVYHNLDLGYHERSHATTPVRSNRDCCLADMSVFMAVPRLLLAVLEVTRQA